MGGCGAEALRAEIPEVTESRGRLIALRANPPTPLPMGPGHRSDIFYWCVYRLNGMHKPCETLVVASISVFSCGLTPQACFGEALIQPPAGPPAAHCFGNCSVRIHCA